MSNIKKIIGIVLALVMVLSMASVAFAADGDAYTISFEVVDGKTELTAGDYTTINVKLTTNFNASAISIPVFFDGSQVTVEASTTLENSNIADETAKDVAKYYESVEHTPDTSALRALVYIAPYYSEIKKYNNETVMTLKITANEDIKTDDVLFECMEGSIKTTEHPAGALYVAKNSSGTNEVDSLPEVVNDATITNATATITLKGNSAEPELLLSEYGESVGAVISRDYCTSDEDSEGNTFAGCVMGIDTLGMYTFDTLDDCLTTPAGSITINTDDSNGSETTGTVIELRNDDGEIVERYVFIYFGDVDRDGMITSGDSSIISDYELTLDGLNYEYELLAADVDADLMVTGADSSIISDYELTLDAEGSFYPQQSEIAANYA